MDQNPNTYGAVVFGTLLILLDDLHISPASEPELSDNTETIAMQISISPNLTHGVQLIRMSGLEQAIEIDILIQIDIVIRYPGFTFTAITRPIKHYG